MSSSLVCWMLFAPTEFKRPQLDTARDLLFKRVREWREWRDECPSPSNPDPEFPEPPVWMNQHLIPIELGGDLEELFNHAPTEAPPMWLEALEDLDGYLRDCPDVGWRDFPEQNARLLVAGTTTFGDEPDGDGYQLFKLIHMYDLLGVLDLR